MPEAETSKNKGWNKHWTIKVGELNIFLSKIELHKKSSGLTRK
jgi:hypothetical protein